MSLKDPDNTNKRVSDTNQDGMVQPPPPSYASSTGANTSGANAKYSPPTTESFYQAQPVGGSSGTQQYAPPAGVPYSPPAGPPPSTGYAPPSQPNPNIHYIPAPTPGNENRIV
ncbi:hypothetical protein BGX28_004234 [Mortierella sp. GBA30]|nr:hypothetical protein BGX28_004234 [Mortierella sp. GBA30]